MALAMLVSAAVGYAAVSALVGGGGNRPRSAASSSVRLPAPAAAPGWLGVDAIGLPITGGALVVDVAPGSPADAAGLQPGDVITQIGNRPVQSPADLNAALAGMHPGQRVEIQYQQGPITNTTQATLGVRPANGP
jgi:S1-C subfamily serine protease